MREPFALGQFARLGLDALMLFQGAGQLARQAFAFGRTDLSGVLEGVLGLLGPLWQGLAPREQRTCGLTHDFDEDPALAPALAAKAPHGFFEAAPEHLASDLEHPNLPWTW
jgi:hypothetical protein